MDRRLLSLTLVLFTSFALSACSWFQEDDGFTAPAAATGEAPQVTPAGQNPVAPGAEGAAPPAAGGGNAFGAGAYTAPGAAPAAGVAATPPASAPIANEQFVRHTIVSGDSLWKLARTYKTSVERISQVNNLDSDKILAGQTITIPTTSPPPGAQIISAPASAAPPATTAAPGAGLSGPAATTNRQPIPSALNPVVKPLPSSTPGAGTDPIAIPRPGN